MIELFSVLDSAAERFIDAFPAPTIDVAIRGFKKACQADGSPFNEFPEDYSLHHVGSFDPTTGEITGVQPHKIAMATSFVGGPGRDLDFHEGNVEVIGQ